MFITKSGLRILETFSGSHPFLDIVISNIKVGNIERSVGDDLTD